MQAVRLGLLSRHERHGRVRSLVFEPEREEPPLPTIVGWLAQRRAGLGRPPRLTALARGLSSRAQTVEARRLPLLSGEAHVDGALPLALGVGLGVELEHLAFLEGIEHARGQHGIVDEDVGAASFHGDKAGSLIPQDPDELSSGHGPPPRRIPRAAD